MYIYIYTYTNGGGCPFWPTSCPGLNSSTSRFRRATRGAPSKKLTGLLLLNMTEMVAQLRAWQLTSEAPKAAAIGLTKEGAWATSALKEYPPALCAGLAGGFVRTLQHRAVDESRTADEAFLRQARTMIVHEYGPCAGPDYAA